MPRGSSCHELTDERLIEATRKGDRTAEFELDGRWRPRLVKLAFSILRDGDLAQDAAQLALWRAFRHLDQYDLARPFGPWILRIAGNCARDLQRRRGTWPEAAAHELLEKAAAPGSSPTKHLGSRTELDALRACMGGLDDRGRAVVALYSAGLSLSEIGSALGGRKSTVQYWLNNALEQLGQCLAAKGFAEEE